MKNPMASTAAQSLSLLLARVPLGLYFGLAGYSKIVAHEGVGGFVTANLPTAMKYVPEHVARGYLTALPFAELLVAALLLFGLFQRIGALLASAMLVSIVLATGVKWMQGPPFNQAIIFLGLALVLLSVGPGKLSADGLLFSNKKPSGKPA
jgi:uncharacterized membrane protein YphA (DoxX/SURF4 family)